jgi:hypothetical protein
MLSKKPGVYRQNDVEIRICNMQDKLIEMENKLIKVESNVIKIRKQGPMAVWGSRLAALGFIFMTCVVVLIVALSSIGIWGNYIKEERAERQWGETWSYLGTYECRECSRAIISKVGRN